MANLGIWEKYYGRGQFFIGFFDEISDVPEELLIRMFHFLGVRSSKYYITEMARKKAYAQNYSAIPKKFLVFLSQEYYAEIVELNERFGNKYTASWLNFAKQHQAK